MSQQNGRGELGSHASLTTIERVGELTLDPRRMVEERLLFHYLVADGAELGSPARSREGWLGGLRIIANDLVPVRIFGYAQRGSTGHIW